MQIKFLGEKKDWAVDGGGGEGGATGHQKSVGGDFMSAFFLLCISSGFVKKLDTWPKLRAPWQAGAQANKTKKITSYPEFMEDELLSCCLLS